MELLYALLIGISAALGGVALGLGLFLLGSPTEEMPGEPGRVRPGGNGLLSGRPVQRRGSVGEGIDKAISGRIFSACL